MEQESIWRQFNALSIEAKREVIDFIAFLQIRYVRPAAEGKTKKSKLKKEPFVGMWKDREDMSGSVAWVRDLRRRERLDFAALPVMSNL
ncbi:MAG: hypothetical protein DKINENOH_00387 [bacterium]|nr:hypothetical protein [bacterium]